MGPDGKPKGAKAADPQCTTDHWLPWMQPSPSQRAWARRMQGGRMISEEKSA